MNEVKAVIVAAMASLLHPSAVLAEAIDGWCFAPDPCMGIIEIRNGRFNTCEESCTLEQQQSHSGGQAAMHKLSCVGDGSPSYSGQAVFLPLENDRAYFLDDLGVHVLQRCEKQNASSNLSNHPSDLGILPEEMQRHYHLVRGICRSAVFDLPGPVSDQACLLLNALGATLSEAGYVFDPGEQEWVRMTNAPAK